MKRLHVSICCLVLLWCAGIAQAGQVVREVQVRVDLSRHPRASQVRLWLPYPTSTPYQLVDDIRVRTNGQDWAVYTDQKYQTSILYTHWPTGAGSRTLELTFRVTRQEVRRRDFPAREAAWDPRDYALWLAPTSLGPIDGQVKELADTITKGKKTVLARAKTIYDWTCENTWRDHKTIGCGKGKVCALLKRPGGKCTDIHSLFVALCRAAGVPAREVFGVRLGKKDVQDVTTWQHCWAEFYLPGYGWVPVDPADVRKAMLKKHLELGDAETKRLRDYYWGGWDAYRVRLALGRDLILNPRQQGTPLNTFGYPYAEVDGRPLNFYCPRDFSYTIVTRSLAR